MNGVAHNGAAHEDAMPARHARPEMPARPTMPSRPHASLKERQRQERERLILQAAADMLVECGYHDMAIEDIAARVGISKGTVYLHFASKEDLVLALVERGMCDFEERLNRLLDAPGSPSEKLHRVFERVNCVSPLRFQMLQAVFQDPALMGRLTEKKKAHEEIWDEPMRRIGELFEEGKASGEFDPSIPTPLMQSLFWSLLTPHSYRRLVVEQQQPLEAVVEHLSRFFFKGIAASCHGPGGRPVDAPKAPGHGEFGHLGPEGPEHADAG